METIYWAGADCLRGILLSYWQEDDTLTILTYRT